MGDVQVTPGEIDDFAKAVAKLHDDWIKPDFAAGRLGRATVAAPSFGSFAAATSADSGYAAKLDTYRTAFQALAGLLDDVRQTSAAIATNYQTAEALADASVADVDKALAESMSDDGGTAGPPVT